MGPATRRLRARLLRETLEHAVANAPYYKERIGALAAEVDGPEDLPKLPTLKKDELVRYGDDLLTSSDIPSSVWLSSGTSFARDSHLPPSVVLQDGEGAHAFEALAMLLGNPLPPGTPRPLAVDIITSVHGARTTPAAPGCFLLPLEKPFHLAMLERWLVKRFSFAGFTERIHYLSGPLNLVRLLAVALHELAPGVLPELSLHAVFTHGDRLSRRWRDLTGGMLGAPVVDVYGVSEVAGAAARECDACGGFHMPPVVVPEVVDLLVDDLPVSSGAGELVLTSLAPFQTLQPLIRYRTGDVVEVLPPCPAVDDLGFRPVGRVGQRSPVAAALAVDLPSFLVHDAVDGLPDVARTPYPRLADFGLGPLFGAPRYRFASTGAGAARLEVELGYVPAYHHERAAEVRTTLLEALATCARRPVTVDVVLTGPDRPLPAAGAGEKVR